MCNICAATRPFESKCSYKDLSGTSTDDVLRATITETRDAPSNTSTTYRIAPGDSFDGSVSNGDGDWIAITLEAGKTFDISLTGESLHDPYLELYDTTGALLTSNDDSDGSLDSRIVFTPSSTGTYYINATSFGSGSGSYELEVDEVRPASLDELADYLVDGFWEDAGREAHSFNVSQDNIITVNLTGLTTQGRELARAAMEAWSAVADLEFHERTGAADITFDDEYSGAYTTSTSAGGYTDTAEINVSTGWLNSNGTRIGTYSFQTYVHELGHALGLGHQGYYNGSADYGNDATFINDSWQASIMSYFSQTDNTTIDASYAFLGTAMPADIIAIQRLYGAADQDSLTAGRTVYGIGHTLGNSWLGQIFTAQSGGNATQIQNATDIALTIHDAGGYDIVDFSNDTMSQYVDLASYRPSSIYGLEGNLQFSPATVIEEYRAGSRMDTIGGNGANNRLYGNQGNDLIWAAEGNDTLGGGIGADTLWGGEGSDVLFGHDGNDMLGGGLGNDSLDGGGGSNTIWGGTGNDTVGGGAGADTLWAGSGSDVLSGSGGNDVMGGGSGQDRLYGGGGNDTIWGGTGNDTLTGGAGRDVLNGSDGIDLLAYWDSTTALSVSLQDNRASGGDAQGDVISNFENLAGGNGNDNLSGNAGSNQLFGSGGADTLWGADDADILWGDHGNDVIGGGNGADNLNGGDGQDRLYGDDGADRLNGGFGADILYGNAGADIFVFSDIRHSSLEAASRDTIRDFSVNEDRIDLSGIDADSAINGNQAFRFIGQDAHTGSGATLRFDQSASGNTFIYGDVDGDGLDDFGIMLTGRHNLAADDFIL